MDLEINSSFIVVFVVGPTANDDTSRDTFASSCFKYCSDTCFAGTAHRSIWDWDPIAKSPQSSPTIENKGVG